MIIREEIREIIENYMPIAVPAYRGKNNPYSRTIDEATSVICELILGKIKKTTLIDGTYHEYHEYNVQGIDEIVAELKPDKEII